MSKKTVTTSDCMEWLNNPHYPDEWCGDIRDTIIAQLQASQKMARTLQNIQMIDSTSLIEVTKALTLWLESGGG